ncbi:MAG: Crp/Fnr family transcriptional regulator [Chloroflexota bacterium]
MVPVEALAQTPMFHSLSHSELADIAELAHRETYEPGATVFLEGKPADHLYVLEDGKVALEMKIQVDESQAPRHTIIDVLSPGETFAWSSLVEPHVLTMSARCVKRSRVIAIDAAGLRQLMSANCVTGYIIMQQLAGVISRRLRDTREQLVGERGLSLVYETLREGS